MAAELDEEQLRAILGAAKDAHGAQPSWSLASAADGSVISAHLRFGVAVLGEDLVVRADWNGPEEQQVMLMFHKDNAKLARLCLTRCHPGQVHWHRLEQISGVKPDPRDYNVDGVSAGPAAIDDMLDAFVAALNIHNLALQGRLYGT